MSAWIVYSKDGITERCVLRSLEYGGTHMGERSVTATFDSSSEVAFEVFDYIEYRGEKFELEAVPTVKKTSDFNYEYELRFVSLKYELERCEMRDLVPNDNGVVYPTPLTFTFTGDVRYLVERIQACLDDLYGKGMWSIIVSDDVKSEEKNISIAQQNCWNALALVSTTYGLNFYVKGRTITIGGEQSLVGHTFEYGKGNGLYEIERAADTGTGIVTKLRAYGASRNLDYSYPKKPEWSDSVLPVSFALSPLRLMLPSFKTDGKTDYVLADDAMIAKYGIREASMVYDDIYPTITGATYNGQAIDEIKAVDEVDESKSTFTVYLHDLGFDLEEHLTTSDAQISMKTGTLQGYTFNISGIEKLSGGYKLTLGRNSLENSEESGAYVPSKNWNMAEGDKFVLLNILMPQAYIREAENRLLARAKEYLAQYGKTNFSYNIGLHDKFLVEHPSVYGALVEGARLSVYDAELGISEDVTIQSITITENMEDNILPQVKVTLNNEPSASTLDRIQGKLNEVAAETAANNFSSQSELMAQYRKKLDKPFFEKLFVAIDKNGNEIATNDVTTPVAYILAKYDFASAGGVTMYAEGGVLNIPSIYNGLPIDNETLYWEEVNGSRVLKAKGGEGSGGLTEVYWNDIKLKPTFALVATSGKYADLSGLPDLNAYATTEYLTAELKKYVTLNTEQTIGAHKDFLNGLSIGGLPITKSQDDVIYLDANLVVRGGITMFGTNSVDVPTIMDAIATDGVNLKVVDGVLTFVGSSGGGLSEVYWDDVIGRPTLLSSFIDDVGYLQKSGGQMTGNIGYNFDRDSANVGVSAAGSFEFDGLFGDAMLSRKSFIGSARQLSNGMWYNVVSVRHKNGNLDGNEYGMYLQTELTSYGDLLWRQQVKGKWGGARVILDSVNWSQYVTAADGGHYLPLSGGEITNSGTGLFINRTTAGSIPHITFESQGAAVGDIGVNTSGSPAFFSYGLGGVSGGWKTLLFSGGSGYTLKDISIEQQYWGNGIKLKRQASGSGAGISSYTYDTFLGTFGVNGQGAFEFSNRTDSTVFKVNSEGDGLFYGGITMYSDQRKKTILNHVELTLQQIADAPLIEHYYNSDEKRTTHVGSIAQYWAGINDWFCKLDSEGYYTMEIQNAALASAISIARELVKYESKTDRKIRLLKDRVKELEDKIEKLENN